MRQSESPPAMSATNEFNIDYVAKLARLELSEAEKQRFSEQLGKVLDYFQMLRGVNTEGVEPMAHAVPLYDVMREDRAGATLTVPQALRNAPKSAEDQILVPRVVE
jgi:aspartyl-tRNA(Asn)/glutamyl-tRNA(Gln) amidotransferase subunit C